jgi:hypothetical protein
MHTKEVCELYELTNQRGEGHKGVYVVGSLCTGERIAVSSQQTRAINLVHALFSERRLESGSRLCVIGGGVAGLTAAAYAISREAVVTVLESHDLLWNLRGCRTRWLHPNLFRHWPHPQWKCTGTNFPVMNWYAGYADDVGEFLHHKYLSFEALQAKRRSSRHLICPGHQIAHDIYVDKGSGGLKVTWTPLKDGTGKTPRERCDVFDAVLIATGFGYEARSRDTEASLYWLDDTLERERPLGRQMRYLISGTGDGGLTDLLRVRVKSFRHHHLRDCLLDVDMYASEIAGRIKDIEKQGKEDEKFDVTEAYKELARAYRLGRLVDGWRDATSVVLTNRESRGALASPAWPVSKFLAAQLLAEDPSTEYRPGRVSWEPEGVHSSDPGQPCAHPECFRVSFSPDAPSDKFDAIVVRHGPQKRTDPSWGETPVPAPLVTLRRFNFDAKAINGARDKWKNLARSGAVTDEPVDPEIMATNHERKLRSKGHTVLPAISGRTIIGMLSRLVSSVGPEENESPVHQRVKIEGPLVTDDVAVLIAQVAHGFRHESSSSGNGWHLGAELNRDSALEVIWAADGYLKDIWNLPADEYDHLERNWVLPCPPWSDRGPLFKHTCVAHHWGEWRLHYVREVPPANAPGRRRRASRQADLVRYAASGEETPLMTILDDCAAKERIAIINESCPRAWRLARELSAAKLYIHSDQKLYPL